MPWFAPAKARPQSVSGAKPRSVSVGSHEEVAVRLLLGALDPRLEGLRREPTMRSDVQEAGLGGELVQGGLRRVPSHQDERLPVHQLVKKPAQGLDLVT